MTQTVFYLNRSRQPAGLEKVREQRLLGVEKLGVIAGFVLGLLIGFGLVNAMLDALGSPDWLTFLVGAVVLATCTRMGQVLALTLAKTEHLGTGRSNAD